MSAAARWIDHLHASLAANFARLNHPVKYVQLATCASTTSTHSPPQSPAWAPRVRTVVFRGLIANGTMYLADDWIKLFTPESATPAEPSHDEPIHLLFVTDLRTRKVYELKSNPLVEVCWYFAHSREQFRLSGVGAVVDGENGAENAAAMPPTNTDWRLVRERMWAAQSPAAKKTYMDEGTESSDLSQVTRHFGLLCVTVNHVDHLNLQNPDSQASTVWTLRQGEYHALRSTL